VLASPRALPTRFFPTRFFCLKSVFRRLEDNCSYGPQLSLGRACLQYADELYLHICFTTHCTTTDLKRSLIPSYSRPKSPISHQKSTISETWPKSPVSSQKIPASRQKRLYLGKRAPHLGQRGCISGKVRISAKKLTLNKSTASRHDARALPLGKRGYRSGEARHSSAKERQPSAIEALTRHSLSAKSHNFQ